MEEPFEHVICTKLKNELCWYGEENVPGNGQFVLLITEWELVKKGKHVPVEHQRTKDYQVLTDHGRIFFKKDTYVPHNDGVTEFSTCIFSFRFVLFLWSDLLLVVKYIHLHFQILIFFHVISASKSLIDNCIHFFLQG